jgi:threonylcarbamoyladenosine tRNA methylthiotransferase MtaB
MKFFVFTTGCKANQWDSHIIADRLRERGGQPSSLEESDVIIINACSLTSRAETDIRRFIQKARSVNDKAKITLVGCHAQAYPDRGFGAELILGQKEKFEARQYETESGTFISKPGILPMEIAEATSTQKGRTRFFYKIQDGCNKFCTYCVVPYGRGLPRSRPRDEILRTMENLLEKGIKEVVLTGIDMAAYRDPVTGETLKRLLASLEHLPTPPRVRLSSLDPEYIDDDFIALLAGSKKIARSMHLPVQSGSDAILKRMGRRHGRDFVAAVIKKLLSGVEGIGIGMDIMVGFPGEDDQAFHDTCSLVEEFGISYLHVFPFSPREGTKAFLMDGAVPDRVKRERVSHLKAVDLDKRNAFARQFMGKRLSVIPEGKMDKNGNMKAFADNYLAVYIPYEKRLENSIVEVTINGVQDGKAIGGTIGIC